MTFHQRLAVFLTVFGIGLAYTVGAFGSVEASHGHSASVFRENARWLALITAVTGLIFLPGKSLFPKFSKILYVCFGILLVWGIFVVVNARSDQQLHIFRMIENKSRLVENAPGAVASTTAKGLVWEVFIVFAYCLMVARSLESRAYKFLISGIALTGGIVAIVGLVHKILGMDTIFGLSTILGRPMSLPETYFAPFVYNANAASLMNLTLAISLGIAFQASRKGGFNKKFYFWIVVSMVTALGVVAAASKAGILILFFQLGLFALFEGKYLWATFQKNRRRRSRKLPMEKKILTVMVVVLFLGGMVIFVGTSISRFGVLVDEMAEGGGAATVEGRSMIRGVVWQLIKDPEGWGGVGPGGFAHIYPFIVPPQSSILLHARWHHAHCDPLQTILEWGYLGALAWFTIGIGAVVRVSYLGLRKQISGSVSHLVKGISIGLVGLGIHSTYDFPLSIFSIHLVALSCCVILWLVPSTSESSEPVATSDSVAPPDEGEQGGQGNQNL